MVLLVINSSYFIENITKHLNHSFLPHNNQKCLSLWEFMGKPYKELRKMSNVRSQKIWLYWPGTIASWVLQQLRWFGGNSYVISLEDSGLSIQGSKDSLYMWFSVCCWERGLGAGELGFSSTSVLSQSMILGK